MRKSLRRQGLISDSLIKLSLKEKREGEFGE